MAPELKKRLIIAFSVLALAVIIPLAAFFCWSTMPVFSKGRPVYFEIEKGSTAKSVGTQLAAQKVPLNGTLFVLLIRVTGSSTGLCSGAYELKAGESPSELLYKIRKGIFAMESITVIEGWRFERMRQAIAKHPGLKHETAAMSDREILKKLNIPHRAAEGLFFPDTYVFKRGTPDMQIYRMAHKAMQEKLDALWEDRDDSLPYKSPYEVLIMASIIEKETGYSDDRDMVSGVFINRIRKGMRLQTDPTVIYGMGRRYQGKIHRADLRRDTPYNTYTRKGLPPTPIALPGKASLEAAFHPAETDALYFVSRGDGTSQFSSNLDDHNKAVDKYIRDK